MMRNLCKANICFLFFALSTLLFALSSEAKVTGNCSNCHTMHNSQGGQPMIYLALGETDVSPKEALLRGTCLGCHGRGPANIVDNTPQILHTGTDLAGGNFAYITDTKTRTSGDSNTVGHNIIDLGSTYKDTTLTSPPGDQHETDITNTNFTCSGAKGCHGDRNVEDKLLSVKGAHHTNDSVLKFGSISIAGQGSSIGLSYRFLKGVKGGEDSDWQAASGSEDHNEYFGNTTMGTSNATAPANSTISGFCAECHGFFHGTSLDEAGGASPWLRHPTDISLPTSGEYTAYTSYNLTAPIARTSGWTGWTSEDSPSGTVTPTGTTDDIVMCLSCHMAHASPYFKMMRWDYKSSITGCNICHTSKN